MSEFTNALSSGCKPKMVQGSSGDVGDSEICAGNLNSNGNDLLVYGKQFGNVFIGVQPTFGYEGDPMRLLFSRSASPHHGFAAYYTFLERVFQADAVLHFGTHGR